MAPIPAPINNAQTEQQLLRRLFAANSREQRGAARQYAGQDGGEGEQRVVANATGTAKKPACR